MILREYECGKCHDTKEYFEERESSMTMLRKDEECGGIAKRVMSVHNAQNSKKESESQAGLRYKVGILIGRVSYSKPERNFN